LRKPRSEKFYVCSWFVFTGVSSAIKRTVKFASLNFQQCRAVLALHAEGRLNFVKQIWQQGV